MLARSALMQVRYLHWLSAEAITKLDNCETIVGERFARKCFLFGMAARSNGSRGILSYWGAVSPTLH
jgi:hypothetical protein